ncbi:hypothetical protein [Flavobacterium sp.]|uniref:hypothetical protein n=1 Tax=Flavobacterium sp. TaxID=239 RepID=UPI003F69542D
MDINEQKGRLLGSLLLFTQVFYKLRTGREFIISNPIGREPLEHIISRELTKTSFHALSDNNRLIINCPPRYGKTELAINFIAWMLARYPDSKFLYVCCTQRLAQKNTYILRNIINLPEYYQLFGVKLSKSSTAKDNFHTIQGGSVYGVGAEGTITGEGAGIAFCERFGGCIIIDDIIKPIDARSQTTRTKVNEWYFETLQSRVNSPKTPIILIGQRVHEDDLTGHLLNGKDIYEWKSVITPALDKANNALKPQMHTKEVLLEMQRTEPYVFYSQYQQEPTPPGGTLFKREWIRRLYEEPTMLATFLTIDTAETAQTYNDATVFSFWGIYKIIQEEIETDLIGLHWIDCHECWIEPKDLKDEFFSFYHGCLRYPKKPYLAAIEKKSTGTTLISMLKGTPGLRIFEIERNKTSGNKISRFIDSQYYVSSGLISISAYSDHEEKVLNHLENITDNGSHRYDDIADTFADAIKLSLIDKIIFYPENDYSRQKVISSISSQYASRLQGIQKSWYK